jgi:hypothetical protein
LLTPLVRARGAAHREPSFAATAIALASHGRALRTVANHLLSVACTLLEPQALSDPTYVVRDAAGA